MDMQILPDYLQSDQTDFLLKTASKVLQTLQSDAILSTQILSYGSTYIVIRDIHGLRHTCQWTLSTKIHILGAGKAASQMAQALLTYLPEKQVEGGIVLTKHGHGVDCWPVQVLEGDHPLPSDRNVLNTHQLLKYINNIKTDDLVFFCLTGGASALMCMPHQGITVPVLQRVNQQLLASGAGIADINRIRSALSQVKGGGLARRLKHVPLVTLTISDVNGDSPESIGSGPTCPSQAHSPNGLSELARRLGIQLPPIRKGPKPPTQPTAIHKYIILENTQKVISSCIKFIPSELEREIIANNFSDDIEKYGQQWQDTLKIANEKKIFIGTSECSVKLIPNCGLGGRNQHLALLLAKFLFMLNREATFLSLGSDGSDGPTKFAGALVNQKTWLQSPELAKQCLTQMNSYEYFKQMGGHIKTGSTGTNLNDFQFLLVH